MNDAEKKLRMIEIVSPEEIHDYCESRGWMSRDIVKEKDIPTLLCLMHSEISEALEAFRDNKKMDAEGGIEEELADLVIRAFHFAALFNINIAEAVKKKHIKNQSRSFRHGRKRC
jgi:NTP pyrophosphatase (non-canonical NTP hydrolase)